MPPGTETVRASETELNTIFGTGGAIGADKCNSLAGDSPFGPGPYGCWSKGILEPGESSKGTFYLKITNVIPNAKGVVEVRHGASSAADSNPGNDKAEVILNPDTAPVADPDPEAVADDPVVVDSAAGLPVTLLILAAGAILLLLCAGGWLYLRRRHPTQR